ncbi:MAG TPA: hemolysin family protein [Thermoanaerobaculia bacterium]|nr:hemolysin family protein [Thermoanaerobaculia bacterium]
MGSSLSHAHWTAIAIVCGLLYLIFDAARSFAQQVGPVTLRRWSGDPEMESARPWFQYDPRNLQLLSGAMLQISLVVAIVATIMAFDDHPIWQACLYASLLWIALAAFWKFVLAFIPEDLGEKILRGLLPFSHFFYLLFWPVVFPLRRLFARLERDHDGDEDEDEVTEEEVQAFIDVGEDEGILEGGEGRMVQSVVEFGDRLAHELMTPRIDVVTFDARRPTEELAQLFSESKYSRIPIYTESIDRITGIVNVKDLFDVVLKQEQKTVSELARAPYFVSETKKVSELLRELQSEHLQVAVVVDEYGGTAGIITLEDIVEEIVGEIADEHEEEEVAVVDVGGGEYLVSGLLRIDDLEEMLDAELANDDYETVAGLIFTGLGRIPKAGDTVRKNGYKFVVDRADRRRIYRVRVSHDPEWERERAEAEG